MRRKTVLIPVALLLGIALFALCALSGAPTSIYNSQNVQVCLLQSSEDVSQTAYEWVPITEELAFTKNTVILSGTVSNVREVSVEYTYMDYDATEYITLFDLSVTDILRQETTSLPDKEIMTIGIPYSSVTYSTDLPIVEEGKEYLLFCYVAEDQENDPLEMAHYLDCWVSCPKDLLIEKVGSGYLTSSFFGSYASDSYLLKTMLSVTETDAEALANATASQISHSSAVQNAINHGITDAEDILSVLCDRSSNSETALWNALSDYYVIPCDSLEAIIKDLSSRNSLEME